MTLFNRYVSLRCIIQLYQYTWAMLSIGAPGWASNKYFNVAAVVSARITPENKSWVRPINCLHCFGRARCIRRFCMKKKNETKTNPRVSRKTASMPENTTRRYRWAALQCANSYLLTRWSRSSESMPVLHVAENRDWVVSGSASRYGSFRIPGKLLRVGVVASVFPEVRNFVSTCIVVKSLLERDSRATWVELSTSKWSPPRARREHSRARVKVSLVYFVQKYACAILRQRHSLRRRCRELNVSGCVWSGHTCLGCIQCIANFNVYKRGQWVFS